MPKSVTSHSVPYFSKKYSILDADFRRENLTARIWISNPLGVATEKQQFVHEEIEGNINVAWLNARVAEQQFYYYRQINHGSFRRVRDTRLDAIDEGLAGYFFQPGLRYRHGFDTKGYGYWNGVWKTPSYQPCDLKSIRVHADTNELDELEVMHITTENWNSFSDVPLEQGDTVDVRVVARVSLCMIALSELIKELENPTSDCLPPGRQEDSSPFVVNEWRNLYQRGHL